MDKDSEYKILEDLEWQYRIYVRLNKGAFEEYFLIADELDENIQPSNTEWKDVSFHEMLKNAKPMSIRESILFRLNEKIDELEEQGNIDENSIKLPVDFFDEFFQSIDNILGTNYKTIFSNVLEWNEEDESFFAVDNIFYVNDINLIVEKFEKKLTQI